MTSEYWCHLSSLILFTGARKLNNLKTVVHKTVDGHVILYSWRGTAGIRRVSIRICDIQSSCILIDNFELFWIANGKYQLMQSIKPALLPGTYYVEIHARTRANTLSVGESWLFICKKKLYTNQKFSLPSTGFINLRLKFANNLFKNCPLYIWKSSDNQT